MIEKTYQTKSGTIHYWISMIDPAALTLVFLPGLTADHRLFDKQIAYFEQKYNVFVWDAQIAGHGFKILAEAMEKDLPYQMTCPALLICGEKDQAGSCIRYNKMWHKKTGHPLKWIKDAGHNANTDQPEIVNQLIEDFCLKLREKVRKKE